MSQVQRCTRPIFLNGRPHSNSQTSHPQHVMLYLEGLKEAVGLTSSRRGLLSSLVANGPGRLKKEQPYDEQGKLRLGYACAVASEDPCVERCVVRRTKERPPAYGLLNGHTCGRWADETVSHCLRQCNVQG